MLPQQLLFEGTARGVPLGDMDWGQNLRLVKLLARLHEFLKIVINSHCVPEVVCVPF